MVFLVVSIALTFLPFFDTVEARHEGTAAVKICAAYPQRFSSGTSEGRRLETKNVLTNKPQAGR